MNILEVINSHGNKMETEAKFIVLEKQNFLRFVSAYFYKLSTKYPVKLLQYILANPASFNREVDLISSTKIFFFEWRSLESLQ